MDTAEDFEVLNDYPDDPDEAKELGLVVSEDPLYDAEQDDQNDKWITKRFKISARDTDAILNCPACFTTCCWDCQKHEEYEQYRAMFVQNCKVYLNRTVKTVPDKRKSRLIDVNPDEIYHPVHCNECDCVLGARDSEEVVHFYHVLASQP